MKPILVREHDGSGSTIAVDNSEYAHFYNPWHYHPELELTFIQKSFGQRHVGDSIENFNAGDIVLIGSNLPHVWKNDDSFFKQEGNIARAIVIKFLPDFAGKGILNIPEMRNIKELVYEVSPYGVKLKGELRHIVQQKLETFSSFDFSARIIQLLDILDTISKSEDYTLLAGINYRNEKVKNAHRINIVLDYIMTHYQEDLTLEKIASLVNMNKNAFCRFFKKGTRKSLFTVINEVRIAKSCQFLVETNMDVLQICYSSGFNNISNFNKTFKKALGLSPLAYKKKMKK